MKLFAFIFAVVITPICANAFWVSSNVVATTSNGAFWVDAPQTGQVPSTNQYAPASMTNAAAMPTNMAPFAVKGANNFIPTGSRFSVTSQRHFVHVWGQKTNSAYLWLTNETTHSVSVAGSPATDVPQTNQFSLWITASGGDTISLTNKFSPSSTVGVRVDGSEDIGL